MPIQQLQLGELLNNSNFKFIPLSKSICKDICFRVIRCRRSLGFEELNMEWFFLPQWECLIIFDYSCDWRWCSQNCCIKILVFDLEDEVLYDVIMYATSNLIDVREQKAEEDFNNNTGEETQIWCTSTCKWPSQQLDIACRNTINYLLVITALHSICIT